MKNVTVFPANVIVTRFSAVHGPSKEEHLKLAIRHVLLKSVILAKSVSARGKDVSGIIVKVPARDAGIEKEIMI